MGSIPEVNQEVNQNSGELNTKIRPSVQAVPPGTRGSVNDKPKPAPTTVSIGVRKTRTYSELKKHVSHLPEDIVAKLNPPQSVNIVVGETGEGKTPLEMQKAICVAAGVPFLDQHVRQAPVVWVDFENGEAPVLTMMEKIAAALGLPAVPEGVHVLSFPDSIAEVDQQIALVRPKLVIVDALRGFDSDAEQYNSKAGKLLRDRYQKVRKTDTSWDFIHHLKKYDADEKPDSLVTAPILQWLIQASGARALINQTAVRTGVQNFSMGQAELVVRGHCKLTGEFGPWHIARIYPDDSDEPIGYRRLTGVHLLQQADRELYAKLPEEFSHKELVKASGKTKGKAQGEWVRRCFSFGLLTKHGQWMNVTYKKTGIALAAKPEISREQQLKALFANWKPEQKYSLSQIQGQFKNHGTKSHADHVHAVLSEAERNKWISSNGPYTGGPQVWWRAQSAAPGVVAAIQAQKDIEGGQTVQ
jgi:hypothetical protein